MSKNRIRPKERAAILRALRAGVVPGIGLQHIQVGRSRELKAMLEDLEYISDGGSTVRFIIGKYGSGKTFFLHLLRSVALEKKMVVVQADLTADRRLQSSGGYARSLYSALMNSLSTRMKQEGGALSSVVDRFISHSRDKAEESGHTVEQVIKARLSLLEEMVSGFDFSRVLLQYWQSYENDNPALRASCLRWLRAEYPTRTSAKHELDVDTIIDDATYYDYLKLMARFVRLAGYKGLVVCLDEMVNLYKMNHRVSRGRNYEQILTIVNDNLQGRATGLGVLFGGTPEFLLDTYRGLYSYEALQTRLAENRFLKDGMDDYSGPVLRLHNLSSEELYVLLANIRHVFASGDEEAYLIPDEAIEAFMLHCKNQIGDAYFRTPRSAVKAFTDLLFALDQNKEAYTWEDLVSRVAIEKEDGQDPASRPGDDLASFKL